MIFHSITSPPFWLGGASQTSSLVTFPLFGDSLAHASEVVSKLCFARILSLPQPCYQRGVIGFQRPYHANLQFPMTNFQ